MNKFTKIILATTVLIMGGCSVSVSQSTIDWANKRCSNNGGVAEIMGDPIEHESLFDVACKDGATFYRP